MMRTEAGAVARCERVQARKALIENEIMQCEGELRTLLMAGIVLDASKPLINRKIDAAIAILQRMQKPGPGTNIDGALQASIPTLIEALNLIHETPGPTLSAIQIDSIHLSFKCLITDLSELAQPNPILASQLGPIIEILKSNVNLNNTDINHWVQVMDNIGSTLASQDDPNKTIQLVAEMGNSILREK